LASDLVSFVVKTKATITLGIAALFSPALASAANPCSDNEPSAMIASPEIDMRSRPTQEKDFYKTKKSGKYGVFHNYQGMMPLSPRCDEKEALANLQKAYDLRVRQIMATYNIDTPYTDVGVSNSDGTDQGVHELGFAVIKEMNRLGIALDCSHSSNRTCIEGAAASTKPIMLSHSNVATLQPIDRNASNEAIKAVASTGGVICVNFIGGFLNANGDASAFSIAKHVEYIRNLTGPEHVCAGSDYVWN
jgi:membrane dipeptidase